MVDFSHSLGQYRLDFTPVIFLSRARHLPLLNTNEQETEVPSPFLHIIITVIIAPFYYLPKHFCTNFV